MLAILLPLTCYLIVKRYSSTAVVMPRHYFADSIISSVDKGKSTSDTVWHQLADFTLMNQMGQKVSLKDLEGKVVVADFFFTHCPTICPRMTMNMKRLQESINNSRRVGDKTPDWLYFISFSIDPERDSVQQLKHWADRFQVNPEQWWLLTGDKKVIYNMAINEMKLPLIDGNGVDTSFYHTDRFVLIDGKRQVRGYYHGLDSLAIRQLSSDIIFLSMEKLPGRDTFLKGQLPVIAVAFLAAIFGVTVLLFILRKKRNAGSKLEKKE
jgi:protein SCO1/2